MGLDGVFLSLVRKELSEKLTGAKIDKIFQPAREEIILLMRAFGGSFRLLISAGANAPRIHITNETPENPASPPMFCMLLRKHLTGAVLREIRQPGVERLLHMDFDARDELGDLVRRTLTAEIMGRRSNLIFTDERGRIYDAVRRSDAESSGRMIMPGAFYQPPPPQDRVDFTRGDIEKVLIRMREFPEKSVSAALLQILDGASPLVCRELEYLAFGGETAVDEMTGAGEERLLARLSELRDTVRLGGTPTMLLRLPGKTPLELTYFKITQYGGAAQSVTFDGYSRLLDAFYTESAKAARQKRAASELSKLVTKLTERTVRKIHIQKQELKQCAGRERLRIYGELINANLGVIEKGSAGCTLENFYDEGKPIFIPLDKTLTPVQNAQKYFKNYRKAQTAERILTEQIALAEREEVYLESVAHALSLASGERETAEIRLELTEQGYLKGKKQTGKKGGRIPKKPASLPPRKFVTGGGLVILCGRNNRQNDELTLRLADKEDIWLHVKNLPGSHVILRTGGKQASEQDIVSAAEVAAAFSKAPEGVPVPVDYTAVRRVKKLPGGKPGMVTYDRFKTVYVTSDPKRVETLCT